MLNAKEEIDTLLVFKVLHRRLVDTVDAGIGTPNETLLTKDGGFLFSGLQT